MLNIEPLKPFLFDYLQNAGIEWKKEGNLYKALCINHSESRPSMAYHADSHSVHCYSCGYHADIVKAHATLRGLHHKVDFIEIVRELADSLNVSLDSPINYIPSYTTNIQKTVGNLALDAKKRAELKLRNILETYSRDNWRCALYGKSKIILDYPSHHWEWLLKALFPIDAHIWLGKDPFDSTPESIKPLKDWIAFDDLEEIANRPADRFALAQFEPEAKGRRNEYVSKCEYILIECDELIGFKAQTAEEKEENKKLNCAFILWLMSLENMQLRAVYDSGNKSLHAIFDRPPERTMKLLSDIVKSDSFGVDSQSFDQPAIPLRLPKSKHEQTNQESNLLYLNPRYNN